MCAAASVVSALCDPMDCSLPVYIGFPHVSAVTNCFQLSSLSSAGAV